MRNTKTAGFKVRIRVRVGLWLELRLLLKFNASWLLLLGQILFPLSPTVWFG